MSSSLTLPLGTTMEVTNEEMVFPDAAVGDAVAVQYCFGVPERRMRLESISY